jgi:hypothetical protein
MLEPRILAIDLRSQLFGFAVLEGPRTLLDYGRKPCRADNTQDNAMIVRKKVAALLAFYEPSVIVLKHASGRSDQPLLQSKESMEGIKCEAKLRSLELVFLSRRDIHRVFRQSGNTSKYRIAALIAGLFPELAWKLPPYRKNWQSEHHNMAIFDAVSLGLAYLAQYGGILPKVAGETEVRTSG